jgi:hypothetical protein
MLATLTPSPARDFKSFSWDALEPAHLLARYGACPESGRRDPAAGSFISRDPVPQGNRYSYAFSDPTGIVDPSGLCGEQTIPNPYAAGPSHDAWQYGYDTVTKALCARMAGGEAGGSGLACGATPDCGNPNACDHTVVDMPEDPHPNSCWHHDTPGLSMAQNPRTYGNGVARQFGLAGDRLHLHRRVHRCRHRTSICWRLPLED